MSVCVCLCVNVYVWCTRKGKHVSSRDAENMRDSAFLVIRITFNAKLH